MIEQRDNQLLLTFPNPEAARVFAQFLATLKTLTNFQEPATSAPPSASSPPASQSASNEEIQPPQPPQPPQPSSPPPPRSRHTILTDERLESLYRQREQSLTQHQRLLKAQTTLRDGVLPFSKPGETPPPSGQPSPRLKALEEGGFADGAQGEASQQSGKQTARKRSLLKPTVLPLPPR
jgi:hypothetical protein